MSKCLKLFLITLFGLFLASSAFAQGSLYKDIAWRYTPAGVYPATTAKITVCTAAGLGTPCTPTVTVYSDIGLTAPVSNPLPTCTSSPQFGCIDGLGNFSFYASPGTYTYTVTGSGLTAYGPIPAYVAVSNGASVSFPTIDQIRFVDTTNTTPQAAIATCPTTDCWVVVSPGTYPFPNNIRSHLHITGHLPGISAATITAATNLVWGTPPVDNKVIFTSSSNVTLSGLWDFSIENVTADFLGNNAGIILQNGVFNNYFDMTIQNCGTGTCMTWNGGSVAGQSVVGNRFRLNVFNAGKGIRMTATAPGVAANNTVYDYVFNNISSIAIECVQQADTNTFRSGFLYGLGNNATGVLINSATPAVDSGCNDNKFLDITTDVLNGGGAFVGTLVQINKSNGTIVDPWSIGGSTNSGTELATTGSPAATICTASDFSVASNSNWCRFLGPTQLGSGGSNINKFLLGSATLTYGAIAAQTCQEQTLAVTGATANTGVWSASPNPGLGNVNLSWSAHADTVNNSVLVRVCNPTVGSITPTAVSWTVSGMQ